LKKDNQFFAHASKIYNKKIGNWKQKIDDIFIKDLKSIKIVIDNTYVINMNLSEIKELIEMFKREIPVGNTKNVVMKTCSNIRNYIEGFQHSGSLMRDVAIFDEEFYGRIRNEWKEEIVYYTVDDPEESFEYVFQDFRHAAHRILTENFTQIHNKNNSENMDCVIETK